VGPWAYYSPLVLGAALVFAMNDAVRSVLPPWSPWAQWLAVAGVALVVAVQCQVLMIGAQGAFAQVVPVPWGRSIRGRAAAGAGWLLIAWVGLSGVTTLLGVEAVTQAAVALGGLSLAALVGAGVIYLWQIPAAIPDFRDERRR
jgi:hypothetical protein